MQNETLTSIGTIGWFAMLIIGALRQKQYGELLVPLFLGMLIIDAWAVAPAQFQQEGRSMAWLWLVALFPYSRITFWLIRWMIKEPTSSSNQSR